MAMKTERPDPEITVVFRPPATDEEREDAWRCFVATLDWLAVRGAMDSDGDE